ncbi:hypothetical protein SDC9_152985 [bioreactor metagenome]|uniref:Uncharacterized protein n=1 Tax=bioreactor metagenome TaxID=1076179 RepID=A0A645EWX8_9ZZZZ
MSHRTHLFFLVTACLALTACSPSQPTYGKRYDKPLTYAQASQEKDIACPFPPSAHNIYYGIYGGGQAYTMIVRFDAPVEDCIKHIDTVLAWDDKNYSRTSSYPRVTVTNVEPVDAGFLTPTAWFTPDEITHGIHVGEDGSHVPQIWVDSDKGTFYFRETD